MNYFAFYEIPVSFKINEDQIRKKFYELSKRYHPDFYITEPQEKQDEILELSTINNKAYQILSHPLKRIEYILSLNNLIQEGEKYQLPQLFLMEMMEVNEALMELELEHDFAVFESIRTQVDTAEAELFDELHVLTGAYDAGSEEEKKSILLKIKDIWYRQKYLLRIRGSLNRFAARI